MNRDSVFMYIVRDQISTKVVRPELDRIARRVDALVDEILAAHPLLDSMRLEEIRDEMAHLKALVPHA